jgi:hypothetical protein
MGKHQLAVVVGGVIAVNAIPASAAPPTAASIHAAPGGAGSLTVCVSRFHAESGVFR